MKVNYIKVGIKILVIVACITTLSSCGFIGNCRYYTYTYFKPRIDKNPYVTMKISSDMFKGIMPSPVTINNVKIPDSLFNNYNTLYFIINKYQDCFILKIGKNQVFNKKTHYYEYVFETIDTIVFDTKNKLEVNIELKEARGYFNIDLLKGRYIWFSYILGNTKQLTYVQHVGCIVENE